MDKVHVIDFGESFIAPEPPETSGMPQSYCSPELIFENKVGTGSDLWALGCTLVVIRTGRRLFNTFDDDLDDVLCYMVDMLGVLPEKWWIAWKERDTYFKENDTESQRPQISIHDKIVERGYLYDTPCLPLAEQVDRDISSEEAKVFEDLLSKIFKYEPDDRLPASQIVHHKWFKM